MFGTWSPSTFHLILFAVGGGLVYLGQEWSVPYTTELGMAVLGVFMIATGVDMMFKRLRAIHNDGWWQQAVVEMYRGIAELLWGLLFLVLGLVMLGFVVMSRFGPMAPEALWSRLLNTSSGLGSILAFTGMVILVNGIIRMLGGSGRMDARQRGSLRYWADRLTGAGVFAVGTAIAVSGLLVLVAPGMVAGALESLRILLGGA